MKALLLAVSSLTIILIIYFFKPSDGFSDLEETVTATQTSNVSAGDKKSEEKESVKESIEQEQADLTHETRVKRYKELEKSRRNLDRSLSRLKAFSWNVKLPREQADKINTELLSAYGLLQHQKLMGAFTSLEAMEDELKKVNYSHNKAKEIIEQIKDLPKK